MLKRQRTLLTLLRRLGGEAGRLDLIKLAFLLREHGRGGESFYDFVPYHYGPYSFSLMQEMTALVRDGFVGQPDDKTWTLTAAGEAECVRNAGPAASGVASIVDEFGKLTTSDLIDHVYDRYPWFGLNTKLKDKTKPKRPTAEPAVYTVGYEKLAVEELLDLLLRSGMQVLVDVRRNPLSRRYGFHGSTLRRLCGYVGVEYAHFPALGIASEERRDLSGVSSYEKLFQQYEATTLKDEGSKIDEVVKFMRTRAAAVMCAEADPCMCHRGRLANEVSRRSGLPIKHLGWPRCEQVGDLWGTRAAS